MFGGASRDLPGNSKETFSRQTRKSKNFYSKETVSDNTQENMLFSKSEAIEYTVAKNGHPLFTHLSIFVVLIGMFWWFVVQDLQIETKHQLGILLLNCLIIFFYLKKIIVQESVLAVGTLGVQISQTNVFGMMSSVSFIPKAEIKSIVINETIRRYRVISYLAVIFHVPDSNDRLIIPIFEETLPRLKTLEKVYTELQNIVAC